MTSYNKAIAGFVSAAIVAYLGAQDGGVTGQEWLTILLAGLSGAAVVFATPKNKPKPPKNQAGSIDLVLLLLMLTLVGVVLLLFRVHFR